MLLVYTSVTPCQCTELSLGERHELCAKHKEKHVSGTGVTRFKSIFGTVYARFRHVLGTVSAQLWHAVCTFCARLGTFLGNREKQRVSGESCGDYWSGSCFRKFSFREVRFVYVFSSPTSAKFVAEKT